VTAAALMSTSILLALFVLSGGAYGLLYGAGELRSSAAIRRAAYACYGAQLMVALIVCVMSPLHPNWKVFLGLSALAYGFIPPLLWRFLDDMHRRPTRLS
jgi:hypothetical protein